MTNEIEHKKEDKNVIINLFRNNFRLHFMQCKNCPAISFCPIVKKQYEKLRLDLDVEFQIKLKEFKDATSGYDKLRIQEFAKSEYERLKRKIITVNIKKVLNNKECKYELQLAKDIMDTMDSKYNFELNPQIYSITEQIAKLKIHDFRLSMAQKNYGVIREVDNELKLTPGLADSIKISREIGELIKKAEEIVNGSKLNINIMEKWEDKLQNFKTLIDTEYKETLNEDEE